MRASAEEFTQNHRWIKERDFLASHERGPLAKAAIALALVAAATAAQWAAWPILKPMAFFAYYPAVVFASLYGNGILAVILSTLLAQTLFVSLSSPPQFHGIQSGLRALTFVAWHARKDGEQHGCID